MPIIENVPEDEHEDNFLRYAHGDVPEGSLAPPLEELRHIADNAYDPRFCPIAYRMALL